MTPNDKKTQNNRSLLTAAHHSYQKGLNSRAFFKVNDRAISEDIVQDTFIKTWRYLVRGGKIEIMKAFLYHILNDLVVDEYRKRKTTSLDALREKGFEPVANNSKRFLDYLDGKAVLLLIPSLPEKYRNVMRMRYIQDLSLKEISLITGQSKNAIAVQIHRGTKKLKQLYEKGIGNSLV